MPSNGGYTRVVTILLVVVLIMAVLNFAHRYDFQVGVEHSHEEQQRALLAELALRTRDRFTGAEGHRLREQMIQNDLAIRALRDRLDELDAVRQRMPSGDTTQ